MVSYNEMVNKVIRESDILLIVIDARRIQESINKELEENVMRAKKKFVYVINKSDLAGYEERKRNTAPNAVFVSAIKHLNTMKLLRRIMQLAKGKEALVGVIGYPNTGKSTLINSLKGRHSTLTSPVSGFTKAIQKVRINSKIMIIDTPGVIPYEEQKHSKEKEIDYLLIGAKDYSKVKDPESAACEIIKMLDGKVEKFFDIKINEDPLETLETIAIKKGLLKKKNQPDNNRAGQEVIKLWQKGKIR